MSSSLYDGLDDVEMSKSGAAAGAAGWVLGGTGGGAGGGPTANTTGIGRLVASASNSITPGGFCGMKMMQTQLAVKRAQGRRAPPGVGGELGPSRPSVAPVVDLNRRAGGGASEGSYRFNQMTGKMERVVSSPLPQPSSTSANAGRGPYFAAGGGGGGGGLQQLYTSDQPNLSLGVADEYNPICPNDFEELARKKRDKRKADDRSRDSGFSRRPNLSGSEGSSAEEDADEEADDDDDGGGKGRRDGGGRQRRPLRQHHRRRPPPPPPSSRAAIAPPSSLLEDVVVTPGSGDSGAAAKVDDTADDDEGKSVAQAASGSYGINLVAAKMMARMGYRQGQGLGKEGQGMSSALVVEKTSRRGGKIIHERDRQATAAAQEAEFPDATVANLAPPANATNVVLLQNMCGGPSEVDDDLEPETAEECAKYGAVVTCMIYQMPDAGEGPEVVRIFVEFEAVEAAARAVLDLNGRFFGGRVVNAGFYDAERFRNLELADQPLS